MIVLIGGEKGGTGKTTILTNLASLAINQNQDILLVDTDKQASASSWGAVRDSLNNIKRIPIIQKFGDNLSKDIKDLEKRYAHILIDAGGQNSAELRSAMIVAHKMIIPIQAAQFDVWTLGVMDHLISQAKIFNSSLLASVLINRVPTHYASTEQQEVVKIFDEFKNFQLSNILIKERVVFRKAARSGLGVHELEKPDLKANNEIINLYNTIYHE